MAGATAISANDLAGLLSDAWALSETGVQSIAVYLELLRWSTCAAFNWTLILGKPLSLMPQEWYFLYQHAAGCTHSTSMLQCICDSQGLSCTCTILSRSQSSLVPLPLSPTAHALLVLPLLSPETTCSDLTNISSSNAPDPSVALCCLFNML